MTPIRIGIAVAASLPLVLTAVRLAGWWPCDVACQGGGFYQRVLGIDVLWAALLGYGMLAALVWHAALRRLHWSAATGATAGLLAGTSLFYLGVAWQLDIVCPFCLTVHGVMLAVLLAVAGDAAGPTAICLLLGLLGTNAVFHHTAVADVVAASVVAPVQSTGNPGALTAANRVALADANRSLGQAAAPITVEYAFSLQCSHCAEQHQPLLDALAPAIAAGRVRLIMRPVVRPADAGSQWLAAWAFAAAEQSPEQFTTFVTKYLSTRGGLTRDELLTLGDDLPARDAAAGGGIFDHLITSDQQTLRTLGYHGATPFVAVVKDGVIRGRSMRDLAIPALVELINQ